MPSTHVASTKYAISEIDKDWIYDAWYTVVEEFRCRQITKITDTLPALTGLAARVQGLTGDTYLAGLWKNDIRSGLLWDVTHHGKRHPQHFIAPSWSWASVRACISFPKETAQWRDDRHPTPFEARDDDRNEGGASLHFEVQDASSSVSGANRFGEVDSGVLRFRGLLKQVRLLRGHYPWGYNVFDLSATNAERHRIPSGPRRGRIVSEDPDEESMDDPLSDYSSIDFTDHRCPTEALGVFRPDVKKEWPDIAWCLPLAYHDGGWGCLALVRTEGEGQNKFRRVGRIDIHYEFQGFEEQSLSIV